MTANERTPAYRARLFSALLEQNYQQEGWDKLFQLLNQGRQAAASAQLPEIARQMEAGQALVMKSLSDTGKFLDWELSILEVGLTAGDIGRSFLRLREHYQLQQQFAAELKRQFTFPLVMAAAALGLMYAWIVAGKHLSVAEAVSYWLLAVAALVATGAGLMQLVCGLFAGPAPEGIRAGVRQLPLLGQIIRSGQLLHFFKNLTQSVDAQLSLTQSLDLAATHIPDRFYQREFMQVHNAVNDGSKLSAAIAGCGLLKGVAIGPMSIRNAGASEAMSHLTEAVYSDYVLRLWELAKWMPQLLFVLLPVVALIQVLLL